jgi:predicted peptidase
MSTKMKHLAIFLLLFLPSFASLAQSPPVKVSKLSEVREASTLSTNPEYLVFTPTSTKQNKVPLLIYLHGAGGGRPPLNRLGMQANALRRGIEKYGKGPCFVVVPQCLPTKKNGERATWEPDDLNLLLDDLLEKFSIDPRRVYLTGNSMGGYGSWAWGGQSPERLAAIAPVVGGIGPGGPKDVTPDLKNWAKNLAKVPVYAFAGGKDRVVPAERSERMVAEIRKAGGKQAKIKVFPEVGHNARQLVYGSKEFYDWMFEQSKK